MIINNSNTKLPLPDPSVWSITPKHYDLNGLWCYSMMGLLTKNVQYYFQCRENSDYDSGYINSNTYTSSKYNYTEKSLTFRFRVKDIYDNYTQWSSWVASTK